MQKKIEDYLPFYLGCKVKWGSDTAVLIDTDKVNCNLFMDGKKYNTSISNIKPYFRLLDSMTEDEQFEMSEITGLHIRDLFVKALQEGTKYVIDVRNSFEVVKYLLSKHFDLFGLIENGLALNEKDLPVTQ